MATHGFIEFRYNEEDIKERTLVHACHDGYLDNMLEDILTLPFYMAHNLKKEWDIDVETPDFLKNTNYNHRHYVYKMFNDKEYKSYESARGMWSSVIPLDDTRYSIISYLIAKRPDMYEVISEPFILYGHAVEEADIKMEFSNERLNTVTISIDVELDDNEEMSHIELIKNINDNLITSEDAKIKILNGGKTIILNFDKYLLDLLFYKKV